MTSEFGTHRISGVAVATKMTLAGPGDTVDTFDLVMFSGFSLAAYAMSFDCFRILNINLNGSSMSFERAAILGRKLFSPYMELSFITYSFAGEPFRLHSD